MEQFGLRQLGKETPEAFDSKILYILVHPFHSSNDKRYLASIEDLIKNSQSPILTLESWELLNVMNGNGETEDRYKRLNPKGERYFLSNGRHYVEPKIGWENTYSIIDEFNPSNILLGGTRLQINNGIYEQCLGTAHNELKERFGEKVNFDMKYCMMDNSPMSKEYTIVTVGGLLEFFEQTSR